MRKTTQGDNQQVDRVDGVVVKSGVTGSADSLGNLKKESSK